MIESSPSPPYDGMVSNALALRSPRQHRSSLCVRERNTLFCHLGRWNARVDVTVFVSGDNDCIVALAALRRGGLGSARSSEPPAASVISRRSGKEDAPLPPRTPECSRRCNRCSARRQRLYRHRCRPTTAWSQTRSLFGAPGSIGHLYACGKGIRSFATSDAGMLASM